MPGNTKLLPDSGFGVEDLMKTTRPETKRIVEDSIIIHICDRDHLYMVCLRSARTPHVFRTLAECVDQRTADTLRNAMIKQELEGT